LGADSGSIDGRGRCSVCVEEGQDFCDQLRITCAELKQEGVSLRRREIQGETESGFYLLVSFWRHGEVVLHFRKEMRGQRISQPRNLRQCPGTFVQFRVQFVRRRTAVKPIRYFSDDPP
jgi:hypothetical protein